MNNLTSTSFAATSSSFFWTELLVLLLVAGIDELPPVHDFTCRGTQRARISLRKVEFGLACCNSCCCTHAEGQVRVGVGGGERREFCVPRRRHNIVEERCRAKRHGDDAPDVGGSEKV